jgi:hypothetical protein
MIVGVWLTMLLFLGMAVDYGIVLRYRRAMQNSCDTGALAGAANLKSDPTTAAGIAERTATQDLTQNNIAANAPTAVTLDSNSQPTLIKPDRVRVDVQATVPTFFYRPIRDSVDVRVECTAKIEPVQSVLGMVPIGLDYTTWLNYYTANIKNGPCDITVPIAQRPSYCQTMTDMLGIGGPGNNGLLCLDTSMGSLCGGGGSGGGPGWEEQFAGVDKNGNLVTTGSYCADPNQVTGVDPNAPACSVAPTKPGFTAGQVTQAVNTRCLSPAPPASQKQILIVPLLNPASLAAGRTSVQITGFAAFQLACPQQAGKSITGSFVSMVTYQAQGCDPATNASCVDTGVETVRLVQ